MSTRVFFASPALAVAALLVLAVAAGVVSIPAPAAADREPVDRVVAMVDDEAILLSDVLQEMNLVRLQRNLGTLSQADQEKLYRTVLESMINDQLLVAQAKAKGIEVTDDELRNAVDEAIADIKQNLGGEEKYRAELQREGITEAELRDLHRDQKRKQILSSRLIASQIRREVRVSDNQVRAYYDTHKDSLPPELLQVPATVRLGHILIVPRPDSTQAQAARAKIESARKRILGGADFATVAKEVSEWPTAESGGFLGNFRYGDFGSDIFDNAVSKLEPGQVSDVIETRFGLQIVKLETRKGDEMTARHIVIKLEPDENANVRALELAQSIRQRAVKGESFEELARNYSDDPNTRDRGGMVEQELPLSELVPEFRSAVDSVPVGGLSQVVRSSNGFHLFKVVSRTDSRTTSFEDVQEQVRRFLEQREVEKRYRAYVEELRKKFYVEVKA
jgi:peptidyl-prolyl cis-trans isomerase SurA